MLRLAAIVHDLGYGLSDRRVHSIMKIFPKLAIAGGVLLVGILVVLSLRIGMGREDKRAGEETGTASEAPGGAANVGTESVSTQQPEKPPAPKKPKPLEFDLQRPDALIVTESLARLPKDVVTLPLFKDLLTEDFFYYYEQNEGGLSLRGTLRRIAYEHELGIGDEVIDYIFNAPARLGFWKGRDGKLGHFMLVMDRGPVVQALELASKVVLNDKQLSLKGELKLPSGSSLPVYELKFAYKRSLFFTSLGDHLLVFSDPEMLLGESPAQKTSLDAFLEASDPTELFLKRFDLGKTEAKDSVAVAVSYFSFGYQRFFPALEAFRFDYGDSGWQASVLLNRQLSEASGLWAAAPTGAAACAALPIEPQTLTGVLGKIASPEEVKSLVDSVESPATICWYRQSRLFTPLVILKMKEGSKIDGLLKEMFEKSIGAHEAGIQVAEEVKKDQAEGQSQEEAAKEAEVKSKKSYFPPFEVEEAQLPEGAVWRREVSSINGKYEETESPNADKMWSKRYFKVTLARFKDFLLFSPDDTLVDNAVSSLDKKYPALSDSIPPKADLSLVVFPSDLGELLRAEVLKSLPESSEPVFRSNVTRGLMPVLDKLESYPAYGLWTPQGGKGWEPLVWQPLESH